MYDDTTEGIKLLSQFQGVRTLLTTHALVVQQEFLSQLPQLTDTLRLLGSFYCREDGRPENQEQDVEGSEHQEAGRAPVQTNTAESRQLHVGWLPACCKRIRATYTMMSGRTCLPDVFDVWEDRLTGSL